MHQGDVQNEYRRRSIRNDELFQVSTDLIHIRGQFGTINDDDLIPWHPILLDLPVPILLGNMEFDLIQGPCCLVTEINVTIRDLPF